MSHCSCLVPSWVSSRGSSCITTDSWCLVHITSYCRVATASCLGGSSSSCASCHTCSCLSVLLHLRDLFLSKRVKLSVSFLSKLSILSTILPCHLTINIFRWTLRRISHHIQQLVHFV